MAQLTAVVCSVLLPGTKSGTKAQAFLSFSLDGLRTRSRKKKNSSHTLSPRGVFRPNQTLPKYGLENMLIRKGFQYSPYTVRTPYAAFDCSKCLATRSSPSEFGFGVGRIAFMTIAPYDVEKLSEDSTLQNLPIGKRSSCCPACSATLPIRPSTSLDRSYRKTNNRSFVTPHAARPRRTLCFPCAFPSAFRCLTLFTSCHLVGAKNNKKTQQ